MKTNEDRLLEEVSDVISKFLKSKGGFGNGFKTFIDGSFNYNVHGGIEVSTPAFDDLTKNQISDIEDELEDKVIKILNKYKFKEPIIARTRHIEHGCYETQLVIEKIVKVKNIS